MFFLPFFFGLIFFLGVVFLLYIFSTFFEEKHIPLFYKIWLEAVNIRQMFICLVNLCFNSSECGLFWFKGRAGGPPLLWYLFVNPPATPLTALHHNIGLSEDWTLNLLDQLNFGFIDLLVPELCRNPQPKRLNRNFPLCQKKCVPAAWTAVANKMFVFVAVSFCSHFQTHPN